MVVIKSKSEIEKMKVAGRITYETLERVREAVRPGVTTYELDKIAEKYIKSCGCTASFKGMRERQRGYHPRLSGS